MQASRLTALFALSSLPLAQDLILVELDPASTLGGDFVVDVAPDGTAVGAGTPLGSGSPTAIRFDPTGPQALPLLAGDFAGEANAIGPLGTIVGNSTGVQTVGSLTLLTDRAVRWDTGGGLTDLGAAATGGAALELFRAWDVNGAGVIVGFGRDASIPAGRGFVWDQGVVSEIPPLPGAPVERMTQAYAINASGQVVGFAEDGGGFEHAILWSGGVLTDLHNTAGIPGRTSKAWDVNTAGWVAGSADFIADFIDWRVAAVWRPDGSVIELGTLGGTVGIAYGINDANDVVGNTTLAGGGNRAFLWREGVMVDLTSRIDPALGWTIVEARSINNSGVIVGLGVLGGGLHTVALVPSPCNGFFEVYGTSTEGSGGFTPALAGFGCPTPGGTVELVLQQGLGGAAGGFVLGTGGGVLSLSPFLDLQVLPLLPGMVPITLSGAGAGQGELELTVPLGPGLLPGDYHAQALFVDPGAAGGVASARPLRMHVQ